MIVYDKAGEPVFEFRTPEVAGQWGWATVDQLRATVGVVQPGDEEPFALGVGVVLHGRATYGPRDLPLNPGAVVVAPEKITFGAEDKDGAGILWHHVRAARNGWEIIAEASGPQRFAPLPNGMVGRPVLSGPGYEVAELAVAPGRLCLFPQHDMVRTFSHVRGSDVLVASGDDPELFEQAAPILRDVNYTEAKARDYLPVFLARAAHPSMGLPGLHLAQHGVASVTRMGAGEVAVAAPTDAVAIYNRGTTPARMIVVTADC